MVQFVRALRPTLGLGLTAFLFLCGMVAVIPGHAAEIRTTSGPLTAAVYSEHSLRLKWWRPGVRHKAILYTVFLDDKVAAKTRRQSYRFQNLRSGTSYDMRVVAYDRERDTLRTIGKLEVKTLGSSTNPFEPAAELGPGVTADPDVTADPGVTAGPDVTADDETPSPSQPSAPTVPDENESLAEAPAQDLPTHAPDGTPYCD